MKVITYRIPYKYGQEFTLKPLFDLHKGAKAHDRRALKQFLSDSDEDTYFIGGGDMMDSIILGDKRYSKSSDATESDAIIDEQEDELYEDLKPYKNRIVGIGIGNHEEILISRCGTNPIKRLCKRLSDDEHTVHYLSKSGLIKLLFREGAGRGRKVVIRFHHGWGGGSRTEGGSLTKYAKDVKHYECDIGLYGHDHKMMAYQIARLGMVGDKLVNKPIHIGLCGTFLKTFLVGDNITYSDSAGYPPVAVGGIKFTIKPHHEGVKIKGYTE
jgi:hypothetical protein